MAITGWNPSEEERQEVFDSTEEIEVVENPAEIILTAFDLLEVERLIKSTKDHSISTAAVFLKRRYPEYQLGPIARLLREIKANIVSSDNEDTFIYG